MSQIAIIEACCAIFIFILFIAQIILKQRNKSQKIINILLLCTFCWLVVDSLSIFLNKPETSFGLLYFLNLCSRLSVPVIPTVFILYCSAFFHEKTKLNKHFFLLPICIEIANFFVFLIAFVTKKIWSYDNGIFSSAYRIPIASIVLYALLGTYVTFSIVYLRVNRKLKSAYIIATYMLPTIVGIVLVRNGIDATAICNGVASVLIVIISRLFDSREIQKVKEVVDNNERILALVDNFESLYDVNLRTMNYETYVKGQTYSEDINPLLINNNNFFDDVIKNVQVVAHPDEIEKFKEIMKPEFMKNALSLSDHFDHCYRLIINGKITWMRIRVTYKNSNKDHLIVGVFNADDEVINREKDQKLRKQLIDGMSSNDALFIVNLDNNSRQTLRNKTIDCDEYNDSEPFTTSISRYINNKVVGYDRRKVREYTSFEYIKEKLKDNNDFSFRYRETSLGVQRFFEMKFAKLSDNEVLMSTTQCDEMVFDKLIYDNLKDDFFAIFAVDTDEGYVRVLKNDPNYLETKTGDIVNYTELMDRLSDLFADDNQTKKYFKQLGDPKYLKAKFAKQDRSSYIFKPADPKVALWATTDEIVLSRHSPSRDPAFVAIGFKLLDKEANDNALLQERLSRDMQMIGGLAGEYQALFYVGIKENIFKIYSIPKDVPPEQLNYIQNSIHGLDFLQYFGNSGFVVEEDKKHFEKLTSEFIYEKLSNEKKYSLRFRSHINNEFIWYELDIIKTEEINEKPNYLIIGLFTCGEEIRKEQALNTCFNIMNKNITSYEAVLNILRTMSEYYCGSRTYVCEILKAKNTLSTTYEWIPENSSDEPRKHKEVNLENLEKWIKALELNETIYIDATDVNMNSLESIEYFKTRNVRSLLISPIIDNGVLVGYIGIDNPTKSISDFKTLKTVATISYSEILKRKQNDEEHVTLQKVTASFICVFFCDLSRDYIHNWKTTRTHRDLFGDVSSYIQTIDHYVTDCIDPVDYERCYKMTRPEYIIEKFKTTDMFSIEMVDTRFQKRYNVVLDYIKVSDDGNQFVICVRNITDTILKEKEHRQKLQEALQQADLANKSKTTFLFNMSHDIRTPMNAIQGFTDMAIKYIDNKEKALDCLNKTQQSGNMLLSLINSVLEVSRIESGHATLDCSPNDMLSTFTTIETTMKELADAKEITLTFDINNIKNRYVLCDIARTIRILVNVISNAIKYTLNGGKVAVSCEQVGEVENGIGKYKYVVADNGIGMSDEFQKHVFEEFSREKTSTVSGIQGTGLGMAVVKSFVDLMNGTITCESKKDVGTTFTIILPFKIQDEAEIQEESEKSVNEEIEAKINLQNKKVLLVDDNALNREIAAEILGDEEMIVETACDGLMALNTVKEKGPTYYDFILMDIQMPIMDGYEATKEIRKTFPDANIPIIALSANAFAEDKQASINAGMNDHVAKPINVKELMQVLTKYIK